MIRIATALALTASPIAAQAKEAACLQKAEAMALLQAMLPAAIEGMATKCSNVLPPGAFLRTGAAPLAERIRKESNFEKGVLMNAFAKAGGTDMPEGISDATLLMLTNDVAKALLVSEMKEKDCTATNDLIEGIAPLPTTNIMQLINGLVSLVPDSGATKGFDICPAADNG